MHKINEWMSMIIQIPAKPEIIDFLDPIVQVLFWILVVFLIGGSLVIRTLWNAKERDVEYIREQDKKTLDVLNNLTTFLQSLNIDVSKLKDIQIDNKDNHVKLDKINDEIRGLNEKNSR